MPLVSMRELLNDAERSGYALPAINFPNLELLYSTLEAAKELRAPVVLQMSTFEVYYFGENAIVDCVKAALDRYGVRAALHLDHGSEYEEIIRCLRRGFTSVMFDGSKLPYEKNIEVTRAVVTAAKAVGVTVEGELGRIMGVEDAKFQAGGDSELTEPQTAADFAAATGVDALAVAIGSAHGFYKKPPKLDFPRLEGIRKATGNLAIVLHGGTGIPDDAIRQAVALGIRKINLSTALKADFIKGFRDASNAQPEEWNLRKLSEIAMKKVTAGVVDFMKLLGCNGKA